MTSAAITGGSSFMTGSCDTPYSRRIATAVPTDSCGWTCTNSGSTEPLRDSTSQIRGSSVSEVRKP